MECVRVCVCVCCLYMERVNLSLMVVDESVAKVKNWLRSDEWFFHKLQRFQIFFMSSVSTFLSLVSPF